MFKLFLLFFTYFLYSTVFPSSDNAGVAGGGESFRSFQPISRVSEEYYSHDGLVKVRCWKSEALHTGQLPVRMKYTIFLTTVENEIGNVEVNYYGKGELYRSQKDEKLLSEPTLHLKYITIFEYERNRGHAKRALDALFQGLKESRSLTIETLVGLEYDVDKPYLGRFYAKYGFLESPEFFSTRYKNPSQYNVMLAQLGNIKVF